MKKTLWVLGACLFAGLWVLAGPGESQGDGPTMFYGYGVEVRPDGEFDDFVRCQMSMFALENEKGTGELPALRISAGDSNSMGVTGVDGVEVTFTCGINAAMTEATYEIAGYRNDRLVVNQLATIRLNQTSGR